MGSDESSARSSNGQEQGGGLGPSKMANTEEPLIGDIWQFLETK